MEETIDKLETMFQKADADLDYLSRKLDSEFVADQEGHQNSNKSPGKMLQKLAEIKKEYAEIVKEAEAIKEAQKEAMNFFRTELVTLCETLGRLQQNIELQPKPLPDEAASAGELLGVELSSKPLGAGDQPCQPPDGESGKAAASEEMAVLPEHAQTEVLKSAAEDTSASAEAPGMKETPAERRAATDELIPVDEKEFQSISSLVRGRVKLSEVNQTYKLLWIHFKEEGNTEGLTPRDMHKMGLRVAGQTGEAKLKVLRALRLLTISNKGVVKLT